MNSLDLRIGWRARHYSFYSIAVLLGTLLCIAMAMPVRTHATSTQRLVTVRNFHQSALPNLATSQTPTLIAPELDPHDPFEGIQQAKLTALDGGRDQAFGTVMASSGDTLLVGAQGNSAAYIFKRSQANRDQWQQVAKLTQNVAGYNFFGSAVALSGDIAVVGSLESIGGNNGYEGVAYVYSRNRGGQNMWGLVRKLLPHDPVMYGNFGATVAIDGDTIVIGATGDGTNGVDAGAAYVFKRNQGGTNLWGEVAKLLASDGAAWDRFGMSVALSQNTIVIGAPQAPGYTDDAGALYVFERATSQSNLWNQVARLTPSDSTNSDQFGELVTLSQDMLMASNPYGGRAYLFERSASDPHAWREVKRFPSASGAGAGYFGGSIATDGDRVLIGAIGSWVNGHEQGLVHVYQRNAGGADQWGEISRLSARDGFDAQRFGSSAVLNSDTIIVGANNDGPGAVYTYRLYARPNLADDHADTTEDTPVAIDVLHNDSTPAGTGALNPASVELLAEPAHGTTSVNATNGAITYTPLPDFNGEDNFTYAVANTIGTSRSATVTVTVRSVNDPPIFTSQPVTQVVAHSLYRYNIAASDVDTGDVLAISAQALPNWLTFSANSGSAILSGTPGDTDVGQQIVQLAVRDTAGLVATQRFTITVVANSPPVFSSAPATIVREGSRYIYAISAADPDPGQALTISAPRIPSWLAFSDHGNGTAVLSGTTSYADVGEHTVLLRAEDIGGRSATQAFTITVMPDQPAAPFGLTAVALSATQLQLSWHAPSTVALGVSVERRAPGGDWSQIATVAVQEQAYIDTALACGATYEYRVRAFNEHWFSESSNIARGTPGPLQIRSFAYNGAARPIYDYSYTTSSIVVNEGGVVADIDLQVDIEHIYDGDLRLVLTAPAGQQIVLSSHTGSFGHNYSGTIFDDESLASISDGHAPFAGSYQPIERLAQLDAQPIAGRWTLRVENTSGAFRGTLKQFALKITVPGACGQELPSPTPAASPTPITTPIASPTPITPPIASPTPITTPAAPPATFVHISAGREHVCALQPDGTLGCWGWNDYDQATVPAGTYRDVDGGQSYTCAVRTSGALACWGRGISGETSPPSGVFTQVSAGEQYACAIGSDSGVACWGYNSVGGPVPPAGTFSKISVGDAHTCGLHTDHTLACWGADYDGRIQAPSGSFTDISAGGSHSCAIRADATLVCWGSNSDGQILAPPGTFTQVSAGESHTCALRTDATVACWGANFVGQIRPPAGKFSQIDTQYDKTCGLRSDDPRSLTCWGGSILTIAPDNLAAGAVGAAYSQQLSAGQGAEPYSFIVVGGALPPGVGMSASGTFSGIPTQAGPFNFIVQAIDKNGLSDRHPSTIRVSAAPQPVTPVPTPVDFPPLGSWPSAQPETLSAGGLLSCGIRTNGALACWGWNNFNTANPPASTYTQISAGMDLACAIRADTHLACWGNNADRNGQYAGQNWPPSGAFTQVSAGQEHACAVRTDGTLACWGSAAYGRVAPPTGIFSQASVGLDHSCAIRSDGTLACWGSNGQGQVFPPSGTFTQISSRYYTSCGVRTDATLSCWGANDLGQATPPNGSFTQVSLGMSFGCARRTDSTLACWGANEYLQAEPPAGAFVQVAAGGDHVCALKLDGTVVCWGRHGIVADIPPAGAFVPDPALLPVPVAARVINVEAPGHAGDGLIDEGEIINDSIKSITVTFSLDIPYLRPQAFMLLSEGATPGFQTSSCARLDAGDQRIESNFLVQPTVPRSLNILFATPSNAGLLNGIYRLILCDTSSGGYPLLDGDANGVGGGDFVRNFAVDRQLPPTTPTTTPTATSTPTPAATPIATPGSGAPLVLAIKAGKPGSAFSITGSGYPADAQLAVSINGERIGQIRTDHAGGFRLILSTTPEAAPGAYVVAVSPVLAANSAAPSASQPATVEYTLDPEAPLRVVAPDGGAASISVPTSIRPVGGLRIYVPLVDR